MKLLLALCVAICFAEIYCDMVLNNAETEGKKHIKECADKNNVNKQTAYEIKKQKSFTISQDAKCFAHCLGEGSGLVDAEGKVAEKFQTNEDVTNCQKTISGTDKCDMTAQLITCLLRKEDFKGVEFPL